MVLLKIKNNLYKKRIINRHFYLKFKKGIYN